jgi:hypothetical protein
MFVALRVLLATVSTGSSFSSHPSVVEARSEAGSGACLNDDSGLHLPAVFCATVFANPAVLTWR